MVVGSSKLLISLSFVGSQVDSVGSDDEDDIERNGNNLQTGRKRKRKDKNQMDLAELFG